MKYTSETSVRPAGGATPSVAAFEDDGVRVAAYKVAQAAGYASEHRLLAALERDGALGPTKSRSAARPESAVYWTEREIISPVWAFALRQVMDAV